MKTHYLNVADKVFYSSSLLIVASSRDTCLHLIFLVIDYIDEVYTWNLNQYIRGFPSHFVFLYLLSISNARMKLFLRLVS